MNFILHVKIITYSGRPTQKLAVEHTIFIVFTHINYLYVRRGGILLVTLANFFRAAIGTNNGNLAVCDSAVYTVGHVTS